MKKLITTLIILVLLPGIIKSQHIGTGISWHTIAAKSDGTVYTWGYNSDGQLGNGTNGFGIYSNVPVAVRTDGVLSGKTIIQVAAGFWHSIALSSDGTVYTWGNNVYGQLGNGITTYYSILPVAVRTDGVLSGKTITQVAAGGYHSIALSSDGIVYTWGWNEYGQLGNGDTTDSKVPVAVKTSGTPMDGKTITQVAAGLDHSIALASDGTVYTWGRDWGALGNGTYTEYSNVPVAVKTDGVLSGKTITQVAAGLGYSIALASDGTVYTWGGNRSGQLGNGTTIESNVPVAVKTDGVLSGKTIIQVATGEFFSIALASDGTIYTWGGNRFGELGNGTNTASNVPVAVKTDGVLSGKTITQVAAGGAHSIALASDGTVYTWGENYDGQLGNGTNENSNVPVEVDQSGMGLLPVEDNLDNQIPSKFGLSQNYPNPFNPTTKIKYTIPIVNNQNPVSVKLKVYDILGNEITTLVNEIKTPGEYEVEFNSKGLSSGMYFYKIEAGNFVDVKKMLILK